MFKLCRPQHLALKAINMSASDTAAASGWRSISEAAQLKRIGLELIDHDIFGVRTRNTIYIQEARTALGLERAPHDIASI